MKRTYSILIVMLIYYGISAQPVTRLQHIPELTPSLASKWGKASMQNDIIGNDFFTDQKIGFSNSNRFHTGLDGWKPVDGYKRTLAGVADSIYEFWEGYNNVDINIDMNSRNILPDFIQRYQHAVAVGLREDEDAADRGLQIELDQYSSSGNRLFKTGVSRPRTKNIDTKPDTLFAFGSLVLDVNHDHKPEIHPAEQIWWRRKENSTDDFYLFFSCDQSDRFDDKRDFDIKQGEEQQFIPWAPRPFKGFFAIPFVVSPGKTKAQFTIVTLSEENSKKNFTDGKLHFLLYKNDTLAVVKENTGNNDRVKVSYHNICNGIDGTGNSVMGYVVLQMEAGKPNTGTIFDNDQGGYLFLKVIRESLSIYHKAILKPSSITH